MQHNSEDHTGFWMILRRNIKAKYMKEEPGETDRPNDGETSRQCSAQYSNPMERLASRQHLGRIMESLEKTGAPEPLLCVNVALRILATVCTDCLDCAETISCRSSSSVQIGMRDPVDPEVDFFFFKDAQCV